LRDWESQAAATTDDRPTPPTPPGGTVTDLDGERTPVPQRAVEQIKEMIARGEVGPGQRLPTERELAVQLGVSRSSMREAIRALTTLGVLDSRHGAGVYVTALRPADLLETFSVLAEVSQGQTLLEVLQVRRMLEPARPPWPRPAPPTPTWNTSAPSWGVWKKTSPTRSAPRPSPQILVSTRPSWPVQVMPLSPPSTKGCPHGPSTPACGPVTARPV